MIKPSDIESLISNNEINDLLLELELETSVLKMKPESVMKISNIVERDKTLSKIKWLEELYVLPLLELANRINTTVCGKKVEFVGLENLSIRGRMFQIREFLLSKGCQIDTIIRVVPKTVEELGILLNARSLGFNLGFEEHQTLDNSERVMRAQQYLDLMEQVRLIPQEQTIEEEYGRSM